MPMNTYFYQLYHTSIGLRLFQEQGEAEPSSLLVGISLLAGAGWPDLGVGAARSPAPAASALEFLGPCGLGPVPALSSLCSAPACSALAPILSLVRRASHRTRLFGLMFVAGFAGCLVRAKPLPPLALRLANSSLHLWSDQRLGFADPAHAAE